MKGEKQNISLHITEDSDTVAEFLDNRSPLGLVCNAASQVDDDIVYQWTKEGRFIDTTSGHVTLETQNSGKQCRIISDNSVLHSLCP